MKIDFEFFGDKQFSREILRVGDRAGNMTPVLEALVDDFNRVNEAQFDSEGASGSGGWAPLADSTVEQKAREGLDPRILHATLALRRSLTQRGDTNQRAIVTPDGLDYGSEVEYGKYHMTGTSRMPQRKPIEFIERDKTDVTKKLQRYLITGEVL